MVYDGDDDDDAVAAGCARSRGTTKACFWMHYWDRKNLWVGVGCIDGHGKGGIVQSLYVLVFWHFSGLANYAKVRLQGHAFDVDI